MKAHALIVAEERNGRTVLTQFRSEPPIALRETGQRETGQRETGEARVSMLGSAAGPVGGDELSMTVHVGAGAALCVEAVAATMVFPSKTGQSSAQHLEIEVAEGGSVRWLGQPLLVIRGGEHVQTTTIRLAAGAQMEFVDEVALGRTGELPGRLDAHLRVERNGLPLLDQRQIYDPTDPAWATTAGVGGFRHIRHRLTARQLNKLPSVTVDVTPLLARARFSLADDVELEIESSVDRCAGVSQISSSEPGSSRATDRAQ